MSIFDDIAKNASANAMEMTGLESLPSSRKLSPAEINSKRRAAIKAAGVDFIDDATSSIYDYYTEDGTLNNMQVLGKVGTSVPTAMYQGGKKVISSIYDAVGGLDTFQDIASGATGGFIPPAETEIKEAEQIVNVDDTKQIKNFEEELKGMVKSSVSDPKKDSQLMEVVNSVGKGLTAGFEWTEGQWKNMTPNSKQALISSLASAYMLSKGYKGSAGNIARGGLEQMRYNDKLSTARAKLENDRKEKAAAADAAYVIEKKGALLSTVNTGAIKSIADSSSFKAATQDPILFGLGGSMNEDNRLDLVQKLASEYKLLVQGGGIKQGSFQDFASNPEVIKSVMQKYKTS